jgi:hypothetical protein
MTRHESAQSPDELRLRRLLDDTVSSIEPDDRLDLILNRTKVTPMSARRPWLFGAGGAALATAAVITAVAMIGNPLKQSADPGIVNTPTPTPTQVIEPTPTETTTSPVTPGDALPVYFVGDTPKGPRLYREFGSVDFCAGDATCLIQESVARSLAGDASDPDYSSLWDKSIQIGPVDWNGDFITLDLQNADLSSTSIHDRPEGMTQSEAELAIQQLIYSAQAALGEGPVPVQFLLDGQHTDQLLGEPASEPLAKADPLDVLALVSLTDPSEGQQVSGTLHVTGQACTFEANVPWQLLQGTHVVDSDHFTADQGCDGVKLYPFEGDIDLSGLAPGTYTLRIQEDDPSGGEGPGPTSDTRTIVVG